MGLKILKIKKIKEKEHAYDVTVNSQSHTFQLGNGVFVHNSLKIPKQYLGCLRGDTNILLLNGSSHTIEELYQNKSEFIGKGIMAVNSDGSLCPTTIKDILLTNPSTSFLRIHLDNGNFVDVTPNHRMILRDGRNILAEDLSVGDSLMPYYEYVKDGRRYVLDNNTGKYKPYVDMLHEQAIQCTAKRKSKGIFPKQFSAKMINNGMRQYWLPNGDELPVGYEFGALPFTEKHKANQEDTRNNGTSRSDTFFKYDSLSSRLPFIEEYVPECNHKVTNIEVINVSEPAYDITVDADCHTFALPCGIFVHNCTDDATGFNGGTSLSLVSSRYAKTVKRIQNTMVQVLTDAINLMLLDKHLDSYINNFQIKMQSPTTQEEKDRKENLQTQLSIARDTVDMLADIENVTARLKIAKTLLSEIIPNEDLSAIIDEEIEKLAIQEKGFDSELGELQGAGEGQDMHIAGGGGGMGDMFSGGDMGGEMPPAGPGEAGADEAGMSDQSSSQLPTPEQLGAGDFADTNNAALQ